ncbi:MAG: leucyl/phenylalanyl-tRNA--protein transferase [Paracoccus sp. (in: a-proteobacteria)]|uniref:leucyl/phenylalanyl-tRNA--protein transferase n=1 Tax=Paracoccus sp. TaxID=267 RepID=UPI0026DEBC3D|nr:leucyl/phenylalanyl-tRNA--protein transferase [Paracoccus sp. (in: a-proteobacteria)]MDO5621300.1 leucyl/phenylalanyl-tRNA--protein transferase [Paracoccus sp. (in: a-proteobacteria)]
MVLTPEMLLTGYAAGIFPMADSADSPDLHWYDPPLRGVLPVGGVHASRSLRRDLRRGNWSASVNHCFSDIVRACANRPETWINAPLFNLYAALHQMGHAHSLEIWHDGRLAGGLFGVSLGGAFFGESMFSARRSGSKMALLWLSAHLRDCAFTLCDTQFITPHLASMGGVEISRDEYRTRLAKALNIRAVFGSIQLPDWQEITQTS